MAQGTETKYSNLVLLNTAKEGISTIETKVTAFAEKNRQVSNVD